MELKLVLGVFVVICLAIGFHAQDQDCATLRTQCERCSQRLNDNNDRNLPGLNRECRQRTTRVWIWQDQSRCNVTFFNCKSQDRRLDCGTMAQLAGMRRRS